ncbi:Gfo/Idh/MocA family protein [Burkholderia anthina]|uniref:1-carboxy-3-chloro-3,4-dihydroxycyclo hexa-1,5-diene dehydrogenase n=1 Tax=Burkholderia anthina TaxID=179879 RepID=A0A6P2G590_9BURK|nr:Gfo/Idh/MocA family oxidoreductase [Burkholderia anthina]MBM2766367.1 Gfo/Idh/MocA family oxidoreductase [Burkholderia anthina]VVU48737.1 1-carboxy-3-chloro-3,4-dihydroxycyclo hexa-1,5-diene dehydrogenase [Burkholderia anthina]
MRHIKLAVAGAGLIGRRHIELVQASERCRLSAIVDPSPAARDVAEAAGVPLYRTLDQLFGECRPDGVVLATPNQLHVAQALECIVAGVPALIEKPVAHTLEEGERLLDAADRGGVPLLVGHHRAHSPILAKARDVIRQGRLGKIVSVAGSAVFYKPDDYFDIAPWRRQAGGGPILINMIHEIGNLRSLCGEIVAVQALSSNVTRGFPVEDTVAINLRFENGALGTFLLSDTAASARSWEQTSQENKSYPTYGDEDCYVIAGDQGSLSVPTMRVKSYARKEDRSWWKPFEMAVEAIDRADPLERQLAHFCDVIEGKAQPLVTVFDGLQNLRIIEAIAEAARSGAIVETNRASMTA